jgi:hypothetical protein
VVAGVHVTSADGKRLRLVDVGRFPGRALVFEMGYLDEAGGDEPQDWTLLDRPDSYVSDQIRGTARFIARAYAPITKPPCGGGCAGGDVCATFAGVSYCTLACDPALFPFDPCAEATRCSLDDSGVLGACRVQAPLSEVAGILVADIPTHGSADARPGRLDVVTVAPDHIAGRFYLAFETLTGQRQGQVTGCFAATLP